MTASHAPLSVSSRRYDLDWLRTVIVLLVLPFHALLVFIQTPGTVIYVRDTLHCAACDRIAGFIAVWQMQMLFAIAGMSTAFALSKRSGGAYLKERLVRLLVPLVFGVLTVVPLMTFLTQDAAGKSITLGQHYARFFTLSADLSGLSGTFTPAHLWFILFLFLFSVIALPLFLLLRAGRSQPALRALARLFEIPVIGLLLLGLPVVLAGQVELLGAQNPLYYLAVFITGYLMATDERYRKATIRAWPWMLALGVILEVLRQTRPGALAANAALQPLWGTLLELNSWVWVLALLGLGQRFLNRRSRLVTYLSETSYPFYILHLLALSLVTLYVIRLPAGILVKYLLILAGSFLLTFLLVEAARRIPPLRFLLGMKASTNKPGIELKEALARAS